MVLLADLLGESRGLTPPPSSFAQSDTTLAAPCAAGCMAPADGMLAFAYGLETRGLQPTPCSTVLLGAGHSRCLHACDLRCQMHLSVC